MSALYTALVESETKESLASMVCELRAQRALLRGTLEDLRGTLVFPLSVRVRIALAETKVLP